MFDRRTETLILRNHLILEMAERIRRETREQRRRSIAQRMVAQSQSRSRYVLIRVIHHEEPERMP